MGRREDILRHVAAVRSRVDTARKAAGRDGERIHILPITKYHPVSDIRIAAELGIRDFGENMQQGATVKIAELEGTPGLSFSPTDLRWHMVGTIQSNKARSIATWAHAVHSLDRLKVAKALGQGSVRAQESGVRKDDVKIYLQLSLDGDPERGGVGADELLSLAENVAEEPGLQLEGLMVVPPVGADAEKSFAEAARVRQRLCEAFPQATGFSAGMSEDIEIAVAYGSTCLRVGTAIFGSRTLRSSQEIEQ